MLKYSHLTWTGAVNYIICAEFTFTASILVYFPTLTACFVHCYTCLWIWMLVVVKKTCYYFMSTLPLYTSPLTSSQTDPLTV